MIAYPDLYQLAVDHQRALIAEADQHRLLTAARRVRAAERGRRSRRHRAGSAHGRMSDPADNLVACGSPAVAPAR